tara:strand:+ start:2272 stop:2499 length:228 start_codon:yes stop_codon:yes gene_type:complete
MYSSPSTKKRLLKTAEAAHLLGLVPGTLINWRSKGLGPDYVKLGRVVRYRVESLNDYVEKKEKDQKIRTEMRDVL